MTSVLFLLSAYILTRLLLPRSLKLMQSHGFVAKNYRGFSLPAPAGLLPILVYLALVALGALWFKDSRGWVVFGLCFVMVLLGLWDDWKGGLDCKGFKGHFNALKQGRLTTGFGKALGGGIIAINAAWFLDSPSLMLLNTLVIALSINFLNLLDLRPGRALKVFLTLSILLAWFQTNPNSYWFLTLVGAALAYFPWDLRSQGMLGDTGANVLGLVIGLMLVVSLKPPAKVMILIVLLGIHLYTEKHSLSELIEKNAWLNYLDHWGRLD